MRNPNPMESRLPVMLLWGAGGGIGAILLFAGLWFGMGALAVPNTLRLVVAICVPPGIMTLAALAVYMARRGQS